MLRAWKVAFIGVLLAIIPEQRSVLWAQDAKDDPTKPAPNPLEELIKRTQEPTKDQTKETPKEDPSKPAQDSKGDQPNAKDEQPKPASEPKDEQAKPAEGSKEDQTKPAPSVKEDTTKPAPNVNQEQAKPAQDQKADQAKPAQEAKPEQIKPAPDAKDDPSKATPESNPDQAKATEQTATYSGKVLVVDREAKTVTMQIEKRLYLLKLDTATRMLREGKKVSINDVITGQEITVQLAEGPNGDVLVTRLFIGPPSEELEAAGKGALSAIPADPGTSPATPAIPYTGSPNRPPVSPYN